MSDDNTTLDKVEELREEVIEKYGLVEGDQDDLIEKLTNDALETKKNQSKTIEQKAKYRQRLVDEGLIDATTFEPIEKPKADAKPKEEEINKPKENQDRGLSVEQAEDLVFLNMGGNQEQLEVLRTVTRNEGKTLSEAKESSYYKWWLNDQEEKKKTEEAQLGASKGSKTNPKKPKVLSQEEHMKMAMNWKKS